MFNLVEILNSVATTTIVPERQISQQTQNNDTFRNNATPQKKHIVVGQLNQHRSYKAAENHRDWYFENVDKKKPFKLGICLIQEPFLRNNKLALLIFYKFSNTKGMKG